MVQNLFLMNETPQTYFDVRKQTQIELISVKREILAEIRMRLSFAPTELEGSYKISFMPHE